MKGKGLGENARAFFAADDAGFGVMFIRRLHLFYNSIYSFNATGPIPGKFTQRNFEKFMSTKTGNGGQAPGGDDDATKIEQSGTDDGDEAGNSGGNNDNDNSDGEGKTKTKQIVFQSQAELDALITKRIARATKDAQEKAKLTETERLERERDDARAEVIERDLRDSFVDETGIEPAKARRYFRMYRDDIETDDKGKALNLKDVIATLKKEFPAEFGNPKSGPGKGKGDGAPGNGGDGKAVGGDMNAALRQMAGVKSSI